MFIHQNSHVEIKYYQEKVLNFDFRNYGNKH